MKFIYTFLCTIGLHRWTYEQTIEGRNPRRCCVRCGGMQTMGRERPGVPMSWGPIEWRSK